MKQAVFLNGTNFQLTEFKDEAELEQLLKSNSRTLFGKDTIYFDSKNKIDSKNLGSTIPDGFMLDFSDPDNPEFYVVEAELARHDFNTHIFPQVTKFLAFFNNLASRNNLAETLFQHIKSHKELESEFKRIIKEKEIYKVLRDTIENSQNILIVIDSLKPEIEEVSRTYSEWDKFVKTEILEKYTSEDKTILILSPEFRELETPEIEDNKENSKQYSEAFHTGDIEPQNVILYEKIKQSLKQIDPNIEANPQKYYISFREKRNFVFAEIRRKKIQLVVMLPITEGQSIIRAHKITQLSDSVQKFYNGPCFKVTVESDKDLDEVILLLEKAYNKQKT